MLRASSTADHTVACMGALQQRWVAAVQGMDGVFANPCSPSWSWLQPGRDGKGCARCPHAAGDGRLFWHRGLVGAEGRGVGIASGSQLVEVRVALCGGVGGGEALRIHVGRQSSQL